MKLIQSISSRVVATFIADEVRPQSGLIPTEVVKAIVDRYQFLVIPELAELNKGNFRSMTFRGGGLVSGRRKIEILELGILEGGIVVDTNHSDDGEFVLDDLITWATSTFGLRQPITELKPVFLSSLIVELDENISKRMDAFTQISSMLSKELLKLNGIEGQYDYSRLAFNCDPALLPQGSMRTEFLIERRANVPFSENRFFCYSPFRTTTTVEILERIEALLVRG